MSWSPGRLLLIANPRAGRGAVQRALPAVRAVLDEAGAAYDVGITEGPGHAEQLARAAIEDGCRFIAAVGGDGTVHEVVNGMMAREGARAPDLVLGVVPSGSGCDLARTFGIPQNPAAAARHLLGDRLWGSLDLGRMRFRSPEGPEVTRWFVNVAEAGIGAQVVMSAARMPRWLGGRAYRLAALKGIATFKPRTARTTIVGRPAKGRKEASLTEVVHQGTVTMVVVANCQFFGGGLRVAPRAIPSDGLLDLLIGEGSKWDALRALRRMPSGSHVPDATIAEFLAERVVIEAGEPLAVEADGEFLGTTPATFEVVPAVLSLKI